MGNRLTDERSPYLRMHMDNPVDWYPWGEAAFEKAKREDKPVFLSVGYSTCHWCHVMAHESFEDEAVAALLNEYYVPVKVDREERPEVDSVYMSFCTAMTGSGGWPLTVIMTPEKEPFFAATYIPRDSRGGRMGLIPLLRSVAAQWSRDGGRIRRMAGELTGQLARQEPASEGQPSKALLNAAAEQLRASYDSEYGGFGTAPKFPTAHNLIFLLRLSKLSGDKSLRAMAEHTLRQMYRGGIYDHLGGGFCRYSTDREWLAPHFEKTLYDNALLALCYTEAWQDGHMALYRQVAEDTLDFCLRELKAPEGGFYCGQDADSGGVEGAYYLFDEAEVKAVLGEDDGRHFCQGYDITPEGNFHGKSIPNLLINQRWNLLPEGWDELRERLRLYREGRMALFTDVKILCSWNGLLLMALSRAARCFSDRRYLLEARELARFMAASMYRDGRLMARLCDGELRFEAQLDDYAFYALGLLELYDAELEAAYIERAAALAGDIISGFKADDGGYYRTRHGAESLPLRPKERVDGALPSGNSAAALLFDRLSRLTGEERWREAAQRQLDYVCGGVGDYPAGYCFGLLAAMNEVYGTRELVCAAPDGELPEPLRALQSRYEPTLTLLLKTPENGEALVRLAPFTKDMTPQKGKPAYYVCQRGACSLPVTEL